MDYNNHEISDANMGEERAFTFIKNLVQKMGLSVTVSAESDSEIFKITATGTDANILVGRNGETLDALQYLATVMVGLGSKNDRRLIVDADNYRDKRNETLIALVLELAKKVAETGCPEKMTPMNSFERRIVHSALNGHEDVETQSEGIAPKRYVVIIPKGFKLQHEHKTNYPGKNYSGKKFNNNYRGGRRY